MTSLDVSNTNSLSCSVSNFSLIVEKSLITKMAKWQKQLYIKQNYPDNYVDKSFLQDMKKNQNVQPLNLINVIHASTKVSQQFSIIILFIITFKNITSNIAEYLLLSNLIVYLYIVYRNRHHLMIGILFSCVLIFMTPILKNLTRDITTDTIYSFTFIMLSLNMLFHDYDADSTAHAR